VLQTLDVGLAAARQRAKSLLLLWQCPSDIACKQNTVAYGMPGGKVWLYHGAYFGSLTIPCTRMGCLTMLSTVPLPLLAHLLSLAAANGILMQTRC
jgi:hypothetical protein